MTTDENYTIEIPNLDETPYIIRPVVLNTKTYYLEYKWNIRSESVFLSIYILVNNEKKYLIRQKGLVLWNNIAKDIYDIENWSGELYLIPIDGLNIYKYNQQNISTDYQLSYVPV